MTVRIGALERAEQQRWDDSPRNKRRLQVQTIVQLGNSNCGWCLNAMSDHLRAQSLVGRVQLNQATGCLVVDHERADPSSLIAQISGIVRGWELASNGEVVIVELDVHEERECRWRERVSDAVSDSEVRRQRRAR